MQNKVKDRVVSWIDFTAINAERERQTEKPKLTTPSLRTVEPPVAGPLRDKINPRSLTEVFNQMEQQPLQTKKIPYKTFEKKSFAQLPSCSPPRI